MLTIACKCQDPVVLFAAAELENTLAAMMPQGSACLELGLFADFGLSHTKPDPEFDDEIALSVENGSGYIAGSNPRSVLMGVYRFLEQCGARWVRPGKDGEYLPEIAALPAVSLREAASKRHRGICIEGAVSIENVLDTVAWLPKVGFNSYYIQFRDAFIFFDRWYAHRGSTVKQPEPFTVEQSLEYVRRIQQEVKKRGLLLHMVGHGWTCEPFGVANHGWDPVEEDQIPQSYKDVCALVNGKREVWKQMPLATNLCYSNPVVRSTMVQGVIDYLKENPSVDVLHFWLGDYYNNSCECEECRKLPVADFYVRTLNDLDKAMTEEGLTAKVVFLIYYDLMTPPVQERIQNPDRFILMFAPISRTFTKSFPEGFAVKEIPPYVINSFTLPSSVDENLAYLYQWEQLFTGDTFDFDYHLMWDHILDAGGEGISRVLYDDIRHFDSLGLDGLVSCQLQRNAFPTSLAMTVMGRTLWNTDTDFDAIRRDLYTAAFGPDAADSVAEYLAALSRCYDVAAIRGMEKRPEGVLAALQQEALERMEAFAPVIAAHRSAANPCHARSWQLLDLHRQLYTLVSRLILARLSGSTEEAEALQAAASQLAWEQEDTLQSVLDCHFFDLMTRQRIRP